MTEQQADRQFSDRLKNIVAANRLDCCSDLPRLNKDEVACLRGILSGTMDTADTIDNKRAMRVLAQADPSTDSALVLEQILSNTKTGIQLRVSAAAALGLCATSEAEQALLKNISTGNRFLRAEIIKSLGKIGSVDAMSELIKLGHADDSNERRLAIFALNTIAFRENLDAGLSLSGFDWSSQAMVPILGDDLATVIGNIRGATYQLLPSPEIGFTASCGGSALCLVLSNVLKRGVWLDTFLSRPLLAGLLLGKANDASFYTVRCLFMTRPDETGFSVVGVRVNGDVVYSGHAEKNSAGFRLQLREVGPQQVPTRIEGTLTNDSIELHLRIWRGAAQSNKHGHAITGTQWPLSKGI